MKIISILAAIAFVGLVAYWVIKESLPLPAPEITYSVVSDELRSQITVPLACEEPIRVFRSVTEGISWERLLAAASESGKESCVFPDTFADHTRDARKLLYRYAIIRPRQDTAHWSKTTRVPLTGFSVSE
ncbi:MAG: hypothetical protein AAB634_01135 [Patescibacteria group bacterium]